MDERERKMLRFGKIGNRMTIFIGVLSVVLPILFWNRIPKEIPVHFGADGIADRIGEKSELILLFFLVLFLLGVMNVATYFVKTNATSQYATEVEKTSLTTTYPMLVVMNFCMISGFSYVIFCAATSRNLGKGFLPIFLFVIFAPMFFFLFQNRKKKRAIENETNRYREMEADVQGEGYRAHVDWWLALLLGGSMVLYIWEGVEYVIRTGHLFSLSTVMGAIVIALILPIFFIKYTLYPEHLLVSCGIYGKERIPYNGITHMKETRNPLSSAAPSLDRIQIDYVIDGRHDMILISPVHKKEFMEKVEKKRKGE